MKKNILYLFLLVTLCGFFTSGCLYEQGPFISIYSPEYRIAYRWQFDRVTFNNLDVTLANNRDSINYGLSYLSFDKSGRFAFLINDLNPTHKGNFVYTGDWSFEDEKRNLKMVYDNDVYPTHTFKILKLTETDFRFRYNEGKDETLFYLLPKK
jgi:hypothetical protein